MLTTLLMLLGMVWCSAGVIHGGTYTITKDPTRENWAELGTFGYGENGNCEVKVTAHTDEAIPYGTYSINGIGFFLVKMETLGSPVDVDSGVMCEPNSNKSYSGFIKLRITPDKNSDPSGSGGEVREVIFNAKPSKKNGLSNKPGFWRLIMYQCPAEGVDDNNFEKYKLVVRVAEFNEPTPGVRNYLQVGDQVLPLAFMVFALVFFGLLIKWGHWMSTNKEHLHKIHFLMALALFLKSGTLFFEAFRYKHYEDSGNMSSFYDYMYYTFLALKGTLLFAVIALIGTGWSFLKPFLHPRDKKILMVVIPLQLLINILWIVIDHWRDGDRSWKFWQDVLSGLDMACCLIVMVPILWSVKQIRNAQQSDGKVAKNLARMKQFRTLYLAIVIYIYFKTIICGMVLTDQVSYENTWIPPVLTEAATLVCFVFVGLKFRPMKENPYTQLDEEDIQEGGEALEQELADLENQARDIDAGNQPHESALGHSEQRRGEPKPTTLSNVRKQPEADF
eukprot:TRINITY_DN5681_c0_g1_i1.p1 TRINITY_DN5681_c0_g1~~TRINITY_DN5681_c0_g1_i1.p1  ORF type:complete len:525 (+),score=146.59 TRINITY_DN5681_c0_g1_i1:63-1577(+)